MANLVSFSFSWLAFHKDKLGTVVLMPHSAFGQRRVLGRNDSMVCAQVVRPSWDPLTPHLTSPALLNVKSVQNTPGAGRIGSSLVRGLAVDAPSSEDALQRQKAGKPAKLPAGRAQMLLLLLGPH